MGHDVFQFLKPESRYLIQNLSLVRNQGGQNIIKGGNPVGGDDQQVIAQIINIPHFSPAVQGQVDVGDGHSHSMVAGGFDEISSTTRLMPRTSLIIRLEILASTCCGK